MILRLLSNSYIGLIIGNIWGLLRDLQPKKPVIWESDFFYKQIAGANLWFSFLFGSLSILFSLPWFTFIPYDLFSRIIASVFLTLGYWMFKGFPINFTKLYFTDDGIEVKIFKQLIVSINPQNILAVITSNTSSFTNDLLYIQGAKNKLLSSSGVHFSLPLDILSKQWGIPIIEAKQVDQIWEKNSDHSIVEKALAYSTILINPVSAMIVYMILAGPFASVWWGLLLLELVSVLYNLITDYFAKGYSKKLNTTVH